MPISLVLADDHPIVLDGLEALFHLHDDFEILARCGTGDETLAAVRKHQPDVLLLDIKMPGKDAFGVVREMLNLKLRTRVVLLTAELDENSALESSQLGVAGVVTKDMAPKLLVQCVRKVHAGERFLEHSSFSGALEKMVRREGGEHEVARLLSPREIEIVRLLASGLPNKAIGKKLFISEGTVKVHLHNIYEKLQLQSRLALSLYARDKGLV
jgi:two-component system, NarL family, nitrate/nitrite response regulator NarL